ncbi:hypothetical protein [Polyangium mundeleinium]|uniref:Uncharacterized protein n=1 Tax=Polyangium mundeleinium TaxID=2995306 RepID=A0ABT5F203_9BACT|nr:hypothetical protein [Polyangium mundeleinium]MDC0748123.1 hypothetical protein [Polyangium mundeleinium]
MPDAWEAGTSVNEVTASATDPLSMEPALEERCAVAVEPLG